MRLTNVLGVVTVAGVVGVLGAGCNSAPPQAQQEQTGNAGSSLGVPVSATVGFTPPVLQWCSLPAARTYECNCTHDVIGFEVGFGGATPYANSCPTLTPTVNGTQITLKPRYPYAWSSGSPSATPGYASGMDVCHYDVDPSVGNALDPSTFCFEWGYVSYVLQAHSNSCVIVKGGGVLTAPELASRMPPKVTFRGQLMDPLNLPGNSVCRIGGSSPCDTCLPPGSNIIWTPPPSP